MTVVLKEHLQDKTNHRHGYFITVHSSPSKWGRANLHPPKKNFFHLNTFVNSECFSSIMFLATLSPCQSHAWCSRAGQIFSKDILNMPQVEIEK